jgi:hypothetical protein
MALYKIDKKLEYIKIDCDYEIKMTDTEDIDYIISLLKQSLRKNKG